MTLKFEAIHQPCPSCNSSDGLSVNTDGSTKCYACGVFSPNKGKNMSTLVSPFSEAKKPLTEPSDASYLPFKDRKISSETARKYKTLSTATKVLFPYNNKDGDKVAQKVRHPDKTFAIEGNWREAVLFGQNLFTKGGKFVTIVEGEFDALAAHQMLGDYPVVSVRNGAQSAEKDCKDNFEWLDSFDKIRVCFDNDEAGQTAAKKVAALFAGKSSIVKMDEGFKDACDYLSKNEIRKFSDRWWKAEEYKPEGIVTVEDIKEQLLTPPKEGLPWCFPSLSELTFGRRKGELYAFGAGVGVGKTDVFTQQIAYDIRELKKRVGVIYLEQSPIETAQRVAGKLDERLYHVPDGGWTRQEYEESVDRLEAMQALYMMNHFGAKEWAEVKKAIRYFAKAKDIEIIYLDHLTALSANEDDERRALDAMMADMAGLAQSEGLIIHFVSHLTTPEGKAHEEGGRVLEKQFTGSRAIARWAHFMFGLERNKQHEDPEQRQVTTFRVLKDRFTGRATGQTFHLKYNKNNGILREYQLSEDF